MKNKGFTLIELLAVIVILAILALIVSPIISGVIKKTKISSATRSMEGFVDSINTASMLYSTDNEGAIASNYADIETLVEAKNKSQIKNPKVTLNDSGIVTKVLAQIDNYYCMYKEGEETICGEEEIDDTLKPGTEVYFNPVSGQKCNKSDYTEDNSASGENGDKCMLFYVIKDNEDTVDLILDHNTSSGIQWNTSDGDSKGPETALAQLKIDAQGWHTSLSRTDSYIFTSNANGVSKNYTVDYTGSKARLITAQEIADITGATEKNSWNEKTASGHYFFDSLDRNQTVGAGKTKTSSDYAWLFNNLGDSSHNCKTYGCTMDKANSSGDIGYWTSSAVAGNSSYAWVVLCYGYVNFYDATYTIGGIRPVITISSDALNK